MLPFGLVFYAVFGVYFDLVVFGLSLVLLVVGYCSFCFRLLVLLVW